MVYNNSAFGLITLEAESIGLPAYREGIEFPNPDYVALATTCVLRSVKRLRPTDQRSSIALWHQTKYRTFRTSNSIRSVTTLWQRSKKLCLHSVVAEPGPVTDERLAGHPRNLANAESKAVTPINPAAQKFHLLILCKAPDNSVRSFPA